MSTEIEAVVREMLNDLSIKVYEERGYYDTSMRVKLLYKGNEISSDYFTMPEKCSCSSHSSSW